MYEIDILLLILVYKILKMPECEVVATEVVIPGSNKTKYLCELCNVSFTQRGNLNKHLKKFHKMQVLLEANQICSLCDERFTNSPKLHWHLQNQHSISLEFADETFYSQQDFLEWKNKIEKEHLVYYKVRDTRHKVGGITDLYYVCNRSGTYKKTGNGIRKSKIRGSIKSGSTCPAFIKVSTQTIDGISEIKVQHQSVHLGHGVDNDTLRLTKLERENLASCLKLGISIDKILEQAKQNTSPTNRYRLLTRKHLHNIKRDYKINSSNDTPQNARTVQIFNADSSNSSIGYQAYIKIEANNHEDTQVRERDTALSSVSDDCNEEFNDKTKSSNDILTNARIVQIFNADSSNSSIGYQDYIEIEANNHEDIQVLEKDTAISSLPNDSCKEFNDKKTQIINRLKELLSRIENWDPQHPLPDVEDHIKALDAQFDMCMPSNMAGNLQEMLPSFTISTPDKPVVKRRRITKKKKGSQK